MSLDWFAPVPERKGYSPMQFFNNLNKRLSLTGQRLLKYGLIAGVLPSVIVIAVNLYAPSVDIGVTNVVESTKAPDVLAILTRIERYCYPNKWANFINPYDDATCKHWLAKSSSVDWEMTVATAKPKPLPMPIADYDPGNY